MLSEETNQLLTRVGPGTPMGDLLRRYWMPIAGVTEFDHQNTQRAIRLLGEDLVLYRDKSGTFGLVDRHCPHRRADLAYGFVEKCGLRCHYHGWLFNEQGKCLEQPYEEMAAPTGRFKDKVSLKSYPVAAHAGILWAYLGPATCSSNTQLGAVYLEEWLRSNRHRRGSVQLAAMPGKLHRPRSL